jgi:hypothetical protein
MYNAIIKYTINHFKRERFIYIFLNIFDKNFETNIW